MARFSTCGLVMMLGLLVPASLLARRQAPVPRPEALGVEESTLLTQGWAYLAQGDFEKANDRVMNLRGSFPRSEATLTLGIEVDIARSGALAALDNYERWLAGHALESPFALRRIARAQLFEIARTASGVRVDALRALAADGDAFAQGALAAAANQGSLAETAALAAQGNEGAVVRIAAALRTPVGNKLALVEAIVQSGSQTAVAPLAAMLQDSRPEHRAAAADGLARLGARQFAGQIQALLVDQNSPPDLRLAAAGALYRFGDSSGVDVLQKAMGADVPGMRLLAAQSLASRPDANWTIVVHGLIQDPDPVVRLGAAKLIAPYEPELARASVDRLLMDPNIAVREEGGRVLARHIAGDFRTLRSLLRSGDAEVRVGAAGRVLELTR